jgi:hypothetical protein
MVASISAVGVLVIDWTTIGCDDPINTDPIATVGVLRLIMVIQFS